MDIKKEKKEKKEVEKKAKKEGKEKKKSSGKNLQLVTPTPDPQRTAPSSSTSTGAIPQSSAPVKEMFMPDMSPLNKLEPNRGVLSFLEQHSKEIGNQQAVVGKDTPVTYAELWRNAKQVVHVLLKKLKLGRGDRVVLLFEPGLEFIHVVLGCFGAGVVAVPMYPPLNVQRDVPKIMKVIDNCKPRDLTFCRAILVSSDVKLFLTTQRLKAKFTNAKGQVLELPSDIVHPSASMESPITYDPNGIALLQYTSGSTGDPKGVMLTHNNVTHNICSVAAANGLNPSSRFASWQPMYHDMGLMGMTLLPIRQRVFGLFMSPVSFITNPPMYIEKAAQYKINQIAGPNFAFGLMARKWPPNKKVDLSSIKHAVIAAEKIVPATLEQFNKVFGPMGFRNDAWTPMFGLAENTVLVTSKTNETVYKVFGDRVSCGVPQFDIVVRIVDPHTCEEVPDEQEGEIWVDSPSKAAGYWGAPELRSSVCVTRVQRSDAVFKAKMVGDDKRTYLRTGDLGRMYGRELTVSGRIKEIVIIRGKKYHPEDIEGAAFDVDTDGILRPGCMVACAYETTSGEEELAVVAEVREEKTPVAKLEQLAKTAIAGITTNCQIQVSRFMFIPPRVLPKTSSGKLQRLKTRDMLANKEFKILFEQALNAETSPAAARAPAATPSGAKTQGKGGPITASFVAIKPPEDLYVSMRNERVVPKPAPDAQKYCDGVAMAAPLWSVPVEEARKRFAAVLTPALPKLSVLSAANVFAEGRHGQIPLRLYKPEGTPLGKALSMTVFIHGGGWVLGGLETHDYFCRDLCRRSGTAVVAIDYRLAPENKFPVPLDDCVDAIEWCFNFSKRLNLNEKNLTIVGESAGANLALAAALVIRDMDEESASEGEEPPEPVKIRGLVALYPALDAHLSTWSQQNYPAYAMPRDVEMFFRDSYIKREQATDPLVSLVYAKLDGLPPVHMISAQCDPMADEGTYLVQKLKDAKVNVTHKTYEGMIHGFVTLPMQFPTQSGEAIAEICSTMKAFCAPPAAP